jgi:hypothetical protein
MKLIAYKIKPAIIAPVLLSLGTLFIAFNYTLWALAALPFIYLASICSAPNFNLADGCLAWIAIFIGGGISFFQKELGESIFCGAALSWILSGIEKKVRAKPVFKDKSM